MAALEDLVNFLGNDFDEFMIGQGAEHTPGVRRDYLREIERAQQIEYPDGTHLRPSFEIKRRYYNSSLKKLRKINYKLSGTGLFGKLYNYLAQKHKGVVNSAIRKSNKLRDEVQRRVQRDKEYLETERNYYQNVFRANVHSYFKQSQELEAKTRELNNLEGELDRIGLGYNLFSWRRKLKEKKDLKKRISASKKEIASLGEGISQIREYFTEIKKNYQILEADLKKLEGIEQQVRGVVSLRGLFEKSLSLRRYRPRRSRR